MKKIKLSIGTFLMLFLGLIYAWSLFAAPLEVAFDWSRSQTSVTFSISITTFCLGSIFSGRLIKKQKPRNLIFLSAILFLIGFFSASKITSIWGLFISYGVLCGLGVGFSYNTILSIIPKWFPNKAGFATGTLLMGMGLGGLVLGTVVKNIMDVLEWAVTFKILSIVFFSVFFVGAFFINGPEDDTNDELDKTYTTKQYPISETLKTKDFWMIFLWTSIVSSIGLGIVSNASYMVKGAGVGEELLPLVVGMVSIGSGVGRLLFGTASDRLGGKKPMAISNSLYIIGLTLALLATKTNIHILIAIGFVIGGLAYGAPSTLSAALAKYRFGEKYYPQNLSATLMVLIPASLIGPTISARVFQLTGGYQLAYLILIGFAIFGFVPIVMLKEEKAPEIAINEKGNINI